MKKILTILAILMMTVCPQMVWGISAVQPTTGDGTADNPYEIATAGNLVWFANKVNDGNGSICGKLTADIDMGSDQTMIGASNNMYAGTFDGGEHTVTIKYTATYGYTALFRFAGGATIKNLKTAGTISTGYQYAGGVISYSDGATIVSRCECSVVIKASSSNSWLKPQHGGIVSYSQGTLSLSDCVFDGQLLGTYKDKKCGGLVGRAESTTTISNCLFNPSAAATLSSTDACTMARGNDVKITNCYYTAAFGTVQGTQATSDMLTSGELCYKLNMAVRPMAVWGGIRVLITGRLLTPHLCHSVLIVLSMMEVTTAHPFLILIYARHIL